MRFRQAQSLLRTNGSADRPQIEDRILTEYCVEARDLTKYFEAFKAVDHVSLLVPAGSIYGVLGPNGAGKTTSLRMTPGIIDPDAGTSRLLGGFKPQSVRHRHGYLPEERARKSVV